jgi:hypothetical protein
MMYNLQLLLVPWWHAAWVNKRMCMPLPRSAHTVTQRQPTYAAQLIQ